MGLEEKHLDKQENVCLKTKKCAFFKNGILSKSLKLGIILANIQGRIQGAN